MMVVGSKSICGPPKVYTILRVGSFGFRRMSAVAPWMLGRGMTALGLGLGQGRFCIRDGVLYIMLY